MKKNKLVLILSIVVSLMFVIFLVKTTDDLGKVETALSNSPNVEDVTDKIQSKILITSDDLNTEWVKPSFSDESWKPTSIPREWLPSDPQFKEGNFGYYRIFVPKEAIKKLSHLENESVLNLYLVMFSRVDIYVNGSFYGTNKPTNHNESIVDVPIKENQDNLIALKGYIKTGDVGINHRGRIFAGKRAETNEMHLKAYKGVTVVSLIFILCKGSIFLIFTLIFLVVRVEKYFETSLLFSMFVILEDIVTGDYITHLVNLNQMIYLYDVSNIGYISCLGLFLASVIDLKVSQKIKTGAFISLVAIAGLITFDVLSGAKFFSIDAFLKFWNITLMVVLLFFILKMIKLHKTLASILIIAVLMTAWSTFFSGNVGMNLKAFANLLIFFTVAYQTFLLFRRQQNQLIEQEKDVAIGRTAAVLAHDVRKPLDQMSLILNRIIEGQTDEEFLKVAQKDIQYSLNSVNNQISDLMNFSRTAELKLKPISLYGVMANSLKQVMSVASNVSIKIDYDFKTNHLVWGEESRLSSAVTNVLVNAVEAIRDIGKKSSGEIRISVMQNGDQVVLKIGNNGPQIPDQIISDIFKPLYTSGKEKGTGLGLASVSKIMKDHQGDIKVENVKGYVEFTLTFRKADTIEVISENEFKKTSEEYGYKTKETIQTKSQIRMFVLDDDKYVFEYLKDIVSKSNYEIELSTFRSSEEAAKALKNKRFDIHLIDYDLGESETGLDFYNKNLKQLNKCVFLHSSREDVGMPDSNIRPVKKPISLVDLNSILAEADKKRLRILLIDDSKLIGVAWKVFHGTSNIHVCLSPEEGLEYFEKHKNEIDACVVDYHFDNSPLNGGDIIERMKKLKASSEFYLMTSSNEQIDGVVSISKSDYDIRTNS